MQCVRACSKPNQYKGPLPYADAGLDTVQRTKCEMLVGMKSRWALFVLGAFEYIEILIYCNFQAMRIHV